MVIEKSSISDLLIIKPRVFYDDRGHFFESFNKNEFKKIGIKHDFIQDNQSFSKKDVLRGLHFQIPPFEQGKLVRVTKGSVLDVAVDLRKNSKTYGKHEKIILSSKNGIIFWIPPGFAHGFLTLEDDTIFQYKCTNIYNKESERTIKWNDKILNINWNIKYPNISEKDEQGINFDEFKSEF
tara:strand:+ start:1191 stop:1733 length:543 start_codon:yes stop_codon:yes gene_type:complete